MVHIAEIYFRAWKKASGKMLEVFSFYLTFTVFQLLKYPRVGYLKLVPRLPENKAVNHADRSMTG